MRSYRRPRRLAFGRRLVPASEICPVGSGLNIAYEAVDRHTTGPWQPVALRCLAESGVP